MPLLIAKQQVSAITLLFISATVLAQQTIDCTKLEEIIKLSSQNSPVIKGQFIEENYTGDKLYSSPKSLTTLKGTYYEGKTHVDKNGGALQTNRFEQILWTTANTQQAISASNQYVEQLKSCGYQYLKPIEDGMFRKGHSFSVNLDNIDIYIDTGYEEIDKNQYTLYININVDIFN